MLFFYLFDTEKEVVRAILSVCLEKKLLKIIFAVTILVTRLRAIIVKYRT